MLRFFGMTNRGMERSRNEDSFFAQGQGELALLVVADGMGGHRAGNVASSMAVDVARAFWEKKDNTVSLSIAESKQAVKGLITKANRLVLEEAERSPEKRGMGTTLTVGLLNGDHLVIGHVGDSRAYRINNESIKLLTKDHSMVEQLIDSGEINPEEAHLHPQRHVLTRALGVSGELKVDIYEHEIDSETTLLFCTDGLTNMVNDEELLFHTRDQQDLQKLARDLVDLANDRGGHDNITVVIATCIGGRPT